MKYLNNREKFININRANLDKNFNINEAFENDITWGDSLIGRLINSVIRKAKIGVNIGRINLAVKALNDAFQELKATAIINSFEGEEKIETQKIKIYSFVSAIKDAVDNGLKVRIIKSLTDDAINCVKEVKSQESTIEGLDKLLEQLENFRKFLDQFDDDEGANDPSLSDEDEKEKDDKDETGKNSAESLYPQMVKNLKALSLVLANYQKVKISAPASKDFKYIYVTKEGDTVEKIQKSPQINKNKLATTEIRAKNTFLTKYPKDNQTLAPGLKILLEGFQILEEATFGTTGGSAERGNIKAGKPSSTGEKPTSSEDHLAQAFTKLKKDIEILISAKEKGIGVDSKFLTDITSKSVDSKTKEQVKNLFTEINRYLVGDKKATIQEKDALYKESLEVITDKNKRVIVAEKIARFTKRALQFDGENLYGGLGDLSAPLKDYVETTKQIMKMTPSSAKKEEVKKPEAKGEVKKESLLLKYDSYIRLIKEADEEISDAKTGTVSEKIKDYFYKNVDIKNYVLKETEVTKMKDSIDKAGEVIEKEGKYKIKLDPVMLIVRCFNRAYKLHTTQVIPSGRSGGRVSNKTFMEYTCFGEGNPSNAGSSGGPYRNNSIFNIWETAVQKILGNPEYQKIFRGETVLLTEEGKEIKDAGKNLRKFMLEMLDGESLYKTGGRSGEGLGRQRDFLEKYFGATPEEIKNVTFETKEEDQIAGTADNIKTKKISFTNEAIGYEKEEELGNTFFALSAKEEGKEKQFYFYIHEVKGGDAYVSYCGTWAFFKDYVLNSGSPPEGDVQGKLPQRQSTSKFYEGTKEYIIKGTKFKLVNIIGKDGKLKKVDFNIKYLSRYEANKNSPPITATVAADEQKLTGAKLYTLAFKGEDDKLKRFKIEKNITDLIKRTGGLFDLSRIREIANCKIS